MPGWGSPGGSARSRLPAAAYGRSGARVLCTAPACAHMSAVRAVRARGATYPEGLDELRKVLVVLAVVAVGEVASYVLLQALQTGVPSRGPRYTARCVAAGCPGVPHSARRAALKCCTVAFVLQVLNCTLSCVATHCTGARPAALQHGAA
jgi:hypothetical protein